MLSLRCFPAWLLLSAHAIVAQISVPTVQWQRSFVGPGEDQLHCSVATPDGGILLGGSATSGTNALRTTPNFGFANFWVVRLDYAGNTLWDRTYGGSVLDNLFSANPTLDGGFILGGPSRSPASGNKTSPWFTTNASTVDSDYWIVRIDGDGNKMWDQSFGGSDDDQLYHVQQTRDGGFILGGFSRSPASGNKTDPGLGSYDYWVIRTDSAGQKLWERCYGGTGDDRLSSLCETDDGGFVLAGYSNPNPAEGATNPHYCWIVRIDNQGNILWDKRFPGSGYPPFMKIVAAAQGGYALSYPGLDFLLYRLNRDGTVAWFHAYGGTTGYSPGDAPLALLETSDAGFIVAGQSSADTSGPKTAPAFGDDDYYVVRVDSHGNQLWDLSFGGTAGDRLTTARQTADGGYVFGGWSKSNTNGNKTAPNLGGFSDYWVVKVGPDCAQLRTSGPIGVTAPLTISLSGPTAAYRIDYSDDFRTWTSFATNQVIGLPVSIAAPATNSTSKRFFRAQRLP